jgi:glycosyltransferase A (GT-A) superfamily protein (DUF2064 family)
MAKASCPGRTKTRLSPPLTAGEAADFNTAFLKDISENLLSAARKASLAGYIAFGPPGSEGFFRASLPPGVGLIEAWCADFGECLGRALEAQFAAGHQAACVLNSDSPTLPPYVLAEMARIMLVPGDRAVLGPSMNWAYYLLACKKLHRRLFEDIAWSTDAVARQTLERAAEIGLPVHVLPEWYDVDDGAALSVLADELLGGKPFHSELPSSPARHSAALLSKLFSETDLRLRLTHFTSGNEIHAPKLEEAAA